MSDTHTAPDKTKAAANGEEPGGDATLNLEELRKKAAERDQYLDLAQRAARRV